MITVIMTAKATNSLPTIAPYSANQSPSEKLPMGLYENALMATKTMYYE
jgi:hypothetical protein